MFITKLVVYIANTLFVKKKLDFSQNLLHLSNAKTKTEYKIKHMKQYQ